MPRRSSYVNSIENSAFESAELVPKGGNWLKPPSIGGFGSQSSIQTVGNSNNGSVKTPRTASIVSSAASDNFPDFDEKPERAASPNFSAQFRDDVGWPMFLYTTLLGLNEGYFKNHRPLEKAYCAAVIVFLFIGSFRRFQQIGTRQPGLPPITWSSAIFDPSTVLTICNSAFLLSGALAALFMMFFRRKRNIITHTYKETVEKYLAGRDDALVAKQTRIAVVFCLLFSIVASTIYKIKALKLPWQPPLITEDWYFFPIEFYLTFLAESSIAILTIFFSHSCNVIRFSIKSLLKEMIPEGDHEDCPLPEESLRRIRDVQVHHQEILSAKTMLEDNFSFVLFYSYGCVIPAICFLGYLILKNISSDNWALHISLGMWIISTMLALLMMSIPAFMIHEDGEKLLSASFKMYHEGLCEERDLLVVSQMTLLVFQMHSAKLTLSASNYFSMNRKILISLFSAIFTYFLILVQFGESTAKQIEENLGDNSTTLIIE